MRVAVLDAQGVLIGAKETDKPKKGAVPCGDLPANGKYRWDAGGQKFIPVGFGHGKPKRPEVDRDRAVYLALKALLEGRPLPQEVRTYVEWYERHVR